MSMVPICLALKDKPDELTKAKQMHFLPQKIVKTGEFSENAFPLIKRLNSVGTIIFAYCYRDEYRQTSTPAHL